MPKPIGTLLTNIIPSEHAWKIKLLGYWKTIIGDFKGRVRIEKITKNSITLGVTHSTWAHELFLLSPMLKQKINRFLQEERIKTIQFKTVHFSVNENAIFVPIKNNSENTKNLIEHCLTITEHNRLKAVSSSELAHALEQFYIRCKKTNKNKGS